MASMSSTKSPVWTNAKELAALQANDEFCKLFKKLKSNQAQKEFAHSRNIATFHYNDDGVLLADVPHKRNPRTVIVAPKAIVNDVLEALHDWPQGGPLGRAKTLTRVRVQFYWPTLRKDCFEYVDSCIKCSQHKTHVNHSYQPVS